MTDEYTITKSISLTDDSARLIRYDRLVAKESNPVSRAKQRGYYDHMLGLTKPEWITFQLERSYQSGVTNAKTFREFLKGKKWVQHEVEKSGNKYQWTLFVEGYYTKSGETKTMKAASFAFDEAMDSVN